MIPMKSKAIENAQAVHTAIMSLSEVYGRQLQELAQENASLRAELAALKERAPAPMRPPFATGDVPMRSPAPPPSPPPVPPAPTVDEPVPVEPEP